ncbi:MAG TPA: phosphate/phosphite/phosphonate ABC transporter substrate-binding protein [Chloroflexota bacterium]|nr:phosphate/phosphite/phosphonate ABC transporter substrate-binding protein [Chloroflexota bacterium]
MRCLLLLLVFFPLASCAAPPAAAAVNLSDLQPLPEVSATAVKPLRVAVAAIISPKGTVDSYGPLLDYLSVELERPVELVQRRTYGEVNDLLQSGEVDLAFVCTSAYIVGKRDFEMQLLVAPQVMGGTVYHSLLIVPADSPAQNMADLRGGVFAFTDPISTSGRNYPIWLVQQMGETPENFFSRTFYTYSHDDAIRAVANHVADGAAVDSLVYAFAIEREPELAQKTRVIHQSPAFGIPPVVISPEARPQLVADLQAALLQMNETAAGQAALRAAGMEGFVLIEDAVYESVRELETAVNHEP